MNERIQKLLKQATYVEEPDGLFPREVVDQAKVAELIVPTIRDISTRELLSAMRNRYEWSDDELIEVGKRLVGGGGVQRKYVTVTATRDEVLAELAGREHVPGKREGKVLRRLMAQTGQDEEWLRAHPRFGMEIADARNPNRQVITAARARQHAPHFGKFFGKLFKVVG